MSVNITHSRKKLLLELLEKSSEPLSGEKLASRLGVSRVSVWKMITSLNENGYRIESAHRGYSLINTTDKPVPWEIGTSRTQVIYHDVLDSTMCRASALLDAGCEDGTTVIAGSQSSGVNSKGGSWNSADGGLYLTRIRRRSFPALFAGLYPIAAAAAAVKVLRAQYGIDALISWPNSITAGNRKLGGVLTEFRGCGDRISSVSAGIGLNLNNSGAIPEDAVSLAELTGEVISVKSVASELLKELEDHDELFPVAEPDAEYGKLIAEAGTAVRVHRTDGTLVSGTVDKLDQSGSLVLKTGNGRFEYIFSGDKIENE